MKWRDRKIRRLDEHGLREALVGLKRMSWFEMVDFIGSRRDKMRRFAEISHIELLVPVERYGNIVYHGGRKFSFILNTNGDTALWRPDSAGSQILEKARKTQLKLQHLKSQKVLSNGRLRTKFRYFSEK